MIRLLGELKYIFIFKRFSFSNRLIDNMAQSFISTVISAVIDKGRYEFVTSSSMFISNHSMFRIKGIFRLDLSSIMSINILSVFNNALIYDMVQFSSKEKDFVSFKILQIINFS